MMRVGIEAERTEYYPEWTQTQESVEIRLPISGLEDDAIQMSVDFAGLIDALAGRKASIIKA